MPIRIVLQRIQSARLLLNGKSFHNEAKEDDEWMECGEGVMIYIAFFKETSHNEIVQLINKIFSNPLFRTLKQETKKHEMECGSSTRSETDILIVPQFALGGKMKSGKAGAQYHNAAKPDDAKEHYRVFCEGLIQRNESNLKSKKCKNLRVNIHCGIFGNRQGLFVESYGPFCHCFDINLQNSDNNKKDKSSSSKKVNSSKTEKLMKSDPVNNVNVSSSYKPSNVCSEIDNIIDAVLRL